MIEMEGMRIGVVVRRRGRRVKQMGFLIQTIWLNAKLRRPRQPAPKRKSVPVMPVLGIYNSS